MLQITRSPRVFDVVVIGSGAGGGTAVKVLTGRGLNVALLEAGPMLNPDRDFKEHVLPHQVDHRGAGPHAEVYFGRQPWGFSYFNAPNGNWTLPGEPYTVAPGSEWRWFRSRILGGRTNHYGRISLRFSDYDFQPEDGLSDPWPVAHTAAPWTRGVPLLRAMRPRLPHGICVHVQPGHDLPRHEDREADHLYRGDGARARGRFLRQGDGGFVRR
jgi:hypothetical protein